jgi:hypothetical protein
MKRLAAGVGDIVYVSDSRAWLGGLRSEHFKAAPAHELDEDVVLMSETSFREAYLLSGRPVTLEKIL